MQTEKENYFRDLEDVIQHLKKEVIREEDLNAKWDLIAKEEGLGCIIFNEENEQSVESESGSQRNEENKKRIDDLKKDFFRGVGVDNIKSIPAKDIDIIEGTMSWKIQGAPLCKTLHISGEGYRFQRWETNWKHPDFQNLMVTVEYDATDAPIEVLWPDTQNNSHSLQSTLNQPS
jgi:hypothetical protein